LGYNFIVLIQFLKNSTLIKNFIYKKSRNRAQTIVDRINNYIKPGSTILDIGAGACGVTEILLEQGYKVTPLDVHNISFVNDITPIIYDGENIPFKDKSFDYSIIILVLHHTKDPENILKEAGRVSQNIILMEEIYETRLQRHLTHFWDDLINLEFFVNPHNNKSISEWESLFKKLNLKLVDTKYHKGDMFPLMKQVTFFLNQGF